MKKSFLIIPVLVLIFAMSIALVGCGGIEWPTNELAQLIPATKEGKVNEDITEDDDSIMFCVDNFSESSYKPYVEECKNSGFDIDVDELTSFFDAYNDDGYKLSLDYYSSKSQLKISIEKPEELGSYTWPGSDLAKLVPKPEAELGRVEKDKSDKFEVIVKMTKEEFNSYITKCQEAGFNKNYDKDDDSYKGYDQNENELKISYEGGNIVEIKCSSSNESETNSTTTAATTTAAATTKAAESGSTSYKEFLDQYEACMNKYVDFMKSYDPTDLSKLSEYTELLQEYNDFLKKYNDIDTSKLDKSDLDYYVEVQGRVNKKLAELYS